MHKSHATWVRSSENYQQTTVAMTKGATTVALVLLCSAFFSAEAATCPIDFNYVVTIPWDTRSSGKSKTGYCQTLLSVFGIGLAQSLRDTGVFDLPDTPTSAACLAEFQSILTSSFALPSNVVSSCFPSPFRFDVHSRYCAGMHTLQDWTALLGRDTAFDRACRPALTNSACNACFQAGLQVVSHLIHIDRNGSHSIDCFYFAVNYAAGIANAAGPKDINTAACIYKLTMLSETHHHHHHQVAVVVLLSLGLLAFVVAVPIIGSYFWFKHRKTKCNRIVGGSRFGPGGTRPNLGPVFYDIDDLRNAAGGFSEGNLIGRGGFSLVYKAILADGGEVAVKVLVESEEDEAQFVNEVAIISNLRHRNLVPLLGCCVGERRCLVYEYMPNGNLHDHLFKASTKLTWRQRRSIVLDVAHALVYLHYGVKPAIFHRDIKATNILLDGAMRARVADFGLAREETGSTSHLTSKVAGTRGYLAPEYALYGQLTEKSDVYSFGVVVLEVMSGRRALEMLESSFREMRVMADWARELVRAGRTREVLEEALVREEVGAAVDAMEKFVLVGAQCAREIVAWRPTIVDALMMLEGAVAIDVDDPLDTIP